MGAKEVERTVERGGFAHFVADDRFAPLDAALFAYRKRVGAVAIPSLAAASLLAKKYAVGIQRVGLDVRTGSHSNFRERALGRAVASVFCAGAELLGIDAVGFLSGGSGLPQPWLGRGESLLAIAYSLDLLEASADAQSGWLEEHVGRCMFMVGELLQPCGDTPSPGELKNALFEHITSQGVRWGDFEKRLRELRDSERFAIRASRSGRVTYDLVRLRELLVRCQRPSAEAQFGDQVGVLLLVREGALVAEDEPLALIRLESGDGEGVSGELQSMFVVSPADQVAMAEQLDEGEPEVIRA